MLVHGRPLVYWDDGLRGWRAVAQSTVWSDGVVVFPPLFDDDLCLLQGVEDLPIQKLVPEAGIEGLAVSILPGTARLDVSCFETHHHDPVPDGLGHELRSIV